MAVKEIRSVHNACVLVEAIAEHQPVGVSDLARVTGLDKSAAQRIAVTLDRAGWLRQSPDGRWHIAPSIARVVQEASRHALIALARPTLEQMRNECGETVMLVTIDHGRLIVLDVAESPHNLRITAPVGSTLPLRHSSAARAMAPHLPPDELDDLRRQDPSLDDGALAESRRKGWAINDREIVPDARVVGAPVLDGDGRAVAAVIVCAPTSRIDLKQMQGIGSRLGRATPHLLDN